jgi:DNA-binding Xre family transcriptional regulator
MLKLNLSYIFKVRGITNSYGFIKKLGFSNDLSHRMAKGETLGVKMKQLEVLCLALHCTPNDLMEFENTDSKTPADHPILSLKRDNDTVESIEQLRKLPLDKIKQLRKLMEEV